MAISSHTVNLHTYLYKIFGFFQKNQFNIVTSAHCQFTIGKIYYSYTDNQLYAHRSLFINSIPSALPCFFTMNLEFLIAMLKSGKKTTDRCFCLEFMRILKYKMKGFFETISLEKEINRSKNIESLLV